MLYLHLCSKIGALLQFYIKQGGSIEFSKIILTHSVLCTNSCLECTHYISPMPWRMGNFILGIPQGPRGLTRRLTRGEGFLLSKLPGPREERIFEAWGMKSLLLNKVTIVHLFLLKKVSNFYNSRVSHRRWAE